MRKQLCVGLISFFLLLLLPSCNEQEVNKNLTDASRLPSVGFNQIGRFDLSQQPESQDVFVSNANVEVEMATSRGQAAVARVELSIKRDENSGAIETQIDNEAPFRFSVNFPVSKFPNGGRVILSAVAIDQLGNRSKVVNQEVIIDTLPPQVVNFRVAINSIQQTDFTQPLSIVQGGVADIRALVRDPVNTVNDPGAGTSATTILLSVNGEVKLQGTNGRLNATLSSRAGDTGTNVLALATGAYTIGIYAVDGAGNRITIQEFELRVIQAVQNDTTPPQVKITSPSAFKIYRVGQEVDVVASASDPESGITKVEAFLGKTRLKQVDNLGAGSTYRFTGTIPQPEAGLLLDKVEVTFTATNGAVTATSASDSRAVVIDEEAPNLQVDVLFPGSGERRTQRIRGYSVDKRVERENTNSTNLPTNVRFIRIAVYRGLITLADIIQDEAKYADDLITEIFTAPREDNDGTINFREGFFEAEWDPSSYRYGQYTLFVDSEDVVGNNTRALKQTRRLTVGFLDRTAPAAAMRIPDQGSTFSTEVPLLVEVSDNADRIDEKGVLDTSQGVVSATFFVVGREGTVFNQSFEAKVQDANNKRRFVPTNSKGTVALSSGKYQAYAVVTDKSGNVTQSNRVDFEVVIDTKPPVANFASPQNGQVITSVPVKVSLTSTDEGTGVTQLVVKAKRYVNGQLSGAWQDIGSVGSGSGDFAWSPQSGKYCLIVVAQDRAGNANIPNPDAVTCSQNEQGFVIVDVRFASDDTSPPVVKINQPKPNDILRGVISLQVQVEEVETQLVQLLAFDNGKLILNKTNIAPNTRIFAINDIDSSKVADGDHVYRVVLINSVGLQGEAEVEVKIDNTAPSVTWLEPTAGATLTGKATLRVRANDTSGINNQSVEFFIGKEKLAVPSPDGNGNYILEIDTDSLGLPDGLYTLKVVVNDKVGNSNSAERSVVISNVDTTQPNITWKKPLAGATVKGTTTLEVEVVDFDNNNEKADVSKVEVFAGSKLIGVAENTVDDIWRVTWNTQQRLEGTAELIYPDGQYSLRAVATDKSGNKAEASINIALSNAIPLAVTLDDANIEPKARYAPDDATCKAALKGEQLACYDGIIRIPVNVNDETGTAKVTLIVESQALGTAPLGVDTTSPYVFSLNTSDYPNDDVLTITAKVERASDGRAVTSGAIHLGIFNQFPLPTIAITNPSQGDELQGLVNVSVSISQPTPTSYSLDLNGNDQVSADESCGLVEGKPRREGMLVQFVDFTNRVLAEQYVDARVSPEAGGSYVTAQPFKTIDLPNDTYVIRLRVVLRNKGTSGGEVCTQSDPNDKLVSDDDFEVLTRSIQVTTKNVNQVPPALLINQPVNKVPSDIPTYRNHDGFVVATATDNVGLDYVELRVFFNENDANGTPSRYVCKLSGASRAAVVLPINPDAKPYLRNSSEVGDYTARVIAQDTDGNRTQQEVTIKIERDSSAARTFTISKTAPLISPVPTNELYTLSISPRPGGHTYTYIERSTETICGGSLLEPSPSSSPAFSLGQSREGTYLHTGQVVTPTRDIFTTNQTAVVVKDSN